MNRSQPTAEIVFDISQVSYDWWFCWPIYIPLLAIMAFLGIAYAGAESLPENDRKPLQRLLVRIGLAASGFVLLCCGIATWADWRSFSRLKAFQTNSGLQVVEGDYVPGRSKGSSPESGGYTSPHATEPFHTFVVKTADSEQTEFDWRLTRRLTLRDVGAGGRLRVAFIPRASKLNIQRALQIERLPPAK